MENLQNYSIKGDRALGSGDVDKLGFREVARRIAISLVDRASEDGLVVGLEGAWGSGKSSLLYLIEEELGAFTANQRATVINFRPWLIGNRDALITSLFGELSRQLDAVALNAGDAGRTISANASKAGEALRNFVSGLGRFGGAIELAGEASGFGPLKIVGKAAKVVGSLAKKEGTPPPLSVLKDNLVSALRDLGHRFIITIDDVDRLEPSEAIEILRLVRSVIDLPNIIYLLCYDSEILAHSIKKAAKIKSGHTYLEKIVQLTIMIPRPEPLQLRQWFTDELHGIASAKNEDELERLKIVIDYEGDRQLHTPRSVVRALDAMRFFWPPLREAEADLADLVWVQLIKDGNPALYRWIEGYCATAAVISVGAARVDEAEKAQELSRLHSIVGDRYFSDSLYALYFAEQLPGIGLDHSQNNNGLNIFGNVSDRDRDEAIRGKRLASPDHYRLYFALAGPSHALTQSEYAAMWHAAEADVEATGTLLLRLRDEQAAGSLTKADVLLERIKSEAYEVLTPQQCEHLLLALSRVMDEVYRRHPFDQFWVNSIWDRAQAVIPPLLSRLDPTRRAAVVRAIFEQGSAVGWLTSLFRHETFAHGRYGDRERSQDDWLFSDAELDLITGLMLHRYQTMPPTEVLGCINPRNLLYAWRQGGDEEGPRRVVEASVVSDEGLVDTLERLTSMINSSDRGKFDVLTKESISPFLDYDRAAQRVKELRTHPYLSERARRLESAFEDGRKY